MTFGARRAVDDHARQRLAIADAGVLAGAPSEFDDRAHVGDLVEEFGVDRRGDGPLREKHRVGCGAVCAGSGHKVLPEVLGEERHHR